MVLQKQLLTVSEFTIILFTFNSRYRAEFNNLLVFVKCMVCPPRLSGVEHNERSLNKIEKVKSLVYDPTF